MNTPSHLILNLAVLRRPIAPAMTWPILIGGLIPDAALFVFYAWARWQGLPESTIWSEAYYSQPSQATLGTTAVLITGAYLVLVRPLG